MKINLLKIFFLLQTLILAVACSEDRFDIDDPDTGVAGREVTVSLRFSPVDQTGELDSRSVDPGLVNEGTTVSDNSIRDIWLIEYDQNDEMLGSPKYFAEPADFGAVTLILPTGNIKYTLVAIANTGHDTLGDVLKSFTDIKTLHKAYHAFNSQSCGYTAIKDADGVIHNVLMMNGTAELTKGSEDNGVTIELHRNVAKIDISITNKAGSGVDIKKVRLCNVPSRISYVDQLVTGSSTEYSSYFAMPDEAWDPREVANESNDGESTQTDKVMNLMYYIPRNMQGTVNNSSGLATQKNRNIPPSATYLEIIAEDAHDKSALRYRFYLGKNMIDNFDIEPNHHYTLPVVISSKGDATFDSRVDIFKNGIFNSSNSYILNYNADHETQNHITVPIDRINYFWGNDNITGDSEFILQTETEWVAEVIWQDTNNDVFHFCNADGTEVDQPHFFKGKGPNSNFSVKPTGNAPGNVLIGVRRADHNGATDGYLWSWYFWVTDYYPYTKESLNDNKYCYSVDNGQIHRYDTQVWKDRLPAASGYYIMDRNFGAYSSAEEDKGTCVYFRFGCKDPLPKAGRSLYKYDMAKDKYDKESGTANGGIVGTSLIGSDVLLRTLEESVKHPNWNYHSGDNWLKDNSFLDWMRPEWDNKYDKSLFDPTPAGWMLPLCDYCPSKDNFTPVPQPNSTTYIALLDKTKPLTNDNRAVFYFSGTQRQGFTSGTIDSSWGGAVIITKSTPASKGYYYAWQFVYRDESANTGNMIFLTNKSFPRRVASATRLVRDPSTDPKDNN